MAGRTLILVSTDPVNSLSVIGLIIPPLASVDVSSRPIDEILFDEDLIFFLGTGQIIINNGTTNFTTVDSALSYVSSYSTLPQTTTNLVGSDGIINNMIILPDSTRGGKLLSINTSQFIWSEEHLNDNDWLEISDIGSMEARYVMPFDGTIVVGTAWTKKIENSGGSISIYINGILNSSLFNFNTNGDNAQLSRTDIDIDFSAGDELRMRFNEMINDGKLKDTIVTLWTKWRTV